MIDDQSGSISIAPLNKSNFFSELGPFMCDIYKCGYETIFDLCNIEPGDMGEMQRRQETLLLSLGAWLWTEFLFKTKMICLLNYRRYIVSQILELYFFILSHFSQKLDSPHVPRLDITHVIWWNQCCRYQCEMKQ